MQHDIESTYDDTVPDAVSTTPATSLTAGLFRDGNQQSMEAWANQLGLTPVAGNEPVAGFRTLKYERLKKAEDDLEELSQVWFAPDFGFRIVRQDTIFRKAATKEVEYSARKSPVVMALSEPDPVFFNVPERAGLREVPPSVLLEAATARAAGLAKTPERYKDTKDTRDLYYNSLRARNIPRALAKPTASDIAKFEAAMKKYKNARR